jgi:hypothetical protein
MLLGHRFANAMGKEPSGLHAAREHPLNLAGRNALLAGAHQMDNLKPKMKLQVRGLKNGSHPHSEGLLAGIALVKADASSFALKPANPIRATAMAANRAIRPKLALNISESRFFVLEMGRVEN